MNTPVSNRIERHNSQRGGLAAVVLLLAAILGSACSGVVMEPEADAVVSGVVPFSGYALQRGDTLALQAQSTTNGAWETIQTVTASNRPTYEDGVAGYFWQFSMNPTLVAARFKRPTGTAHQAVVFFRIQSQTSTLPPAETHMMRGGNAVSPTGSNIADLWARYKTSDSLLRIRIPN